MTKKDYELIAEEIKKMQKMPIEVRETGKKTLYFYYFFAHSLATRLQERNTKFNREKFLKACGVDY